MGKNLKGKELGVGLGQRPDGRYEARAIINGVRINLYNKDLKELRKEFEKAKEKARDNIDLKMQNITLDEWFTEWFTKYKAPYIKSSSVYPMTSKYKSTFGERIGSMKVVDIRNIHVQAAVNDLNKSGRASSSIRDALGTLRNCMESARNNKIISANPCFEIMVPWKKKSTLRRFLTEEEQNRFLQEVEHDHYKEMYYIMFLTGLRIGEVGGLKWQDIDFEKKCINVSHSLMCQYEAGVKTIKLTAPKTQNSYRKIPFIGEVEEMLLSQKTKQEETKKNLGTRYRAQGELEDLVFNTTMGSPVTRYVAEKQINKVVDSINEKEMFEANAENREFIEFKKVYPHAFRHTFCSRCFEKGLKPKVVQMLMGHATYSTTIEIYTHVTEENLDVEVAKFGSAHLRNEENSVRNCESESGEKDRITD